MTTYIHPKRRQVEIRSAGNASYVRKMGLLIHSLWMEHVYDARGSAQPPATLRAPSGTIMGLRTRHAVDKVHKFMIGAWGLGGALGHGRILLLAVMGPPSRSGASPSTRALGIDATKQRKYEKLAKGP